MSTNYKANIDIIIPVCNALDDIRHCITSILANKSSFNISLIIVNDASEENTTQFLRSMDVKETCIRLLENDVNKGYARTANLGMKLSTAPYVILMNSDIIVSKYWLHNLVECAESDSKIGIVSPVTNAAIWQSVPFIPNSPTVSTNSFPQHEEVDRFADLVTKCSYSIYPRLPYIHGFCQFIKREVIDAIGYVDEKNFPNGLGSEQDYCYRAADAGYLSVIADDTFIYHSKAKSLNMKARKFDWERNLNDKHGEQRHRINKPIVNGCREMNALRMATTFELFSNQLSRSINSFNYNVCIFVSSEDTKSIDFFLSLLKKAESSRGCFTIVVKKGYLSFVLKKYRHYPASQKGIVGFQAKEELFSYLGFYDAVVCSDPDALIYLSGIQTKYPALLVACYLSDKVILPEILMACEKRTDPLYLKSVLFLTHSDASAKTVIQTLGIHAFNLTNLQKKDRLSCIISNVAMFFKPIDLMWSKRQNQVLMLLLKDAILFHRKDQDPVVFSKGLPSNLINKVEE